MDWLLAVLLLALSLPGILTMVKVEPRLIKKVGGEEIPFLARLVSHLLLVVPSVLIGTWLYKDAGFLAPSLSDLGGITFFISIVCAVLHLVYYYGYLVKITEEHVIEKIDSVRRSVGLATRVLYGGIVEELIFRWGLMSFLVWGVNTWFRVNDSDLVYWFAILVSSLLFALIHLPGAKQTINKLTPALLIYVIGANVFIGICCGWLFWKSGLLSAIICHMLFHIIWFGFEKTKWARTQKEANVTGSRKE
ncbi:CPBP family intramembrane glutamic endopeptidase [Brevibacillus sp. SIMBA_040]|uniref:CPBP family intramembrane glutamic endopeptidase n=1 Tax=unclassified Brevibacillus TaxID=2684853 RepID=UPI00397E80FB